MSALKKNLIIGVALIAFFSTIAVLFETIAPYPFLTGAFLALVTYPLWDIIETKIRGILK